MNHDGDPPPEVVVLDAAGAPIPIVHVDRQPDRLTVTVEFGGGGTDPVTGLADREALLEALERRLARLDHDPAPAGVVVFDLDQFVERLGEEDRTAAMAQVARRLDRKVRAGDLLGRWGVDSFVVVFGAPTSEVEATVAANRLLEEVRPAGFTASAGIAFAARREPASLLIEQGRAAVELARLAGGDGVARFDPHAGGSAEWVRRRTLDLRAGIERGDIALRYQPVVDLSSGQVTSGEALAVWLHPEEGRLGAGEFVPLAEATGLIGHLTDAVTRLVIAQLATWKDQLPAGVRVAVNLSAADLLRPDLVAGLLARCAEAGVSPGRLRIEVTESVLIADPDRASATMSDLRSAGVGVSLDDFGTGFSSLSMLTRLPVDTLKIDRSFIAGISSDEAAFAVVRLINGLAHELGMSTVAEGIESHDQRDRAVAAGCRFGQGRLFADALEPDEFLHRAGGNRSGAG